MKRAAQWITALVLGVGWVNAGAQMRLEAVSAVQQTRGELIRIELSEPLTVAPVGFVIQSPPRVVIDLPGVVGGLAKPVTDLNQGNVRSVSQAQTPIALGWCST